MSSRNSSAAIGVFDSGIGGLTVVREINRHLPDENIIYLGDTARLPFGGKSALTIQRYSLQIADFLLKEDVKALVIACNTASAWALDQVRRHSPVPVIGVIHAGCSVAVDATRNGRIGVIGTKATIRSGAYPAGIRRLMPEALILARSCPLFVPLVEEGWLQHSVTDQVIAEYCQPLVEASADTLVLGCTHYPLLAPALQRHFGEEVSLVSSSQALAVELSTVLAQKSLLADRGGRGINTYYFTDYSDVMARIAELFLDDPAAKITEVDL